MAKYLAQIFIKHRTSPSLQTSTKENEQKPFNKTFAKTVGSIVDPGPGVQLRLWASQIPPDPATPGPGVSFLITRVPGINVTRQSMASD